MTLNLVLNKSSKKKSYRAKNKHESEPIICPECGGRQFSLVVHNPIRKNMKWEVNSGFITLECVTCEITVARHN